MGLSSPFTFHLTSHETTTMCRQSCLAASEGPGWETRPEEPPQPPFQQPFPIRGSRVTEESETDLLQGSFLGSGGTQSRTPGRHS